MKKSLILIVAAFLTIIAPLDAFAAEKKILDIQELETPGGFNIWFVQDKTVPVVTLSFAFRGGIAQDPPGLPGLAYMVSILLDEGAGPYDSQAFQQELQKHAINLKFSAGRDAFFGEVKTLSKNKTKAFELLKLALTEPHFNAEAVSRMRAAHMARIRMESGDPNWIVARAFNGSVFEGHIYAQPGRGNLESIGKITREDLRGYIDKNFARKNLMIAVAGDIDPEELKTAVDSIFSALPEKPDLQKVQDIGELEYQGKTILLDMPVPQTLIMIGQVAVPRKDPDWYAARLVNFVLGESGFGSRLMEEVREKRGLTYGVYTSIVNQDHADLIQLNTSTVNDKTGEVLALIKTEWKRMAEQGPTQQELDNARAYLIGALPLQLSSTDDITQTLLGLQLDELPVDYLDRRQEHLQSVSLEEARKVASRILRPDTLSIILVGQPVGVVPDIKLEKPPGMNEE